LCAFPYRAANAPLRFSSRIAEPGQWGTRFRSWISELRISDTITNTGRGGFGGAKPPRERERGASPNPVEAHHPLFIFSIESVQRLDVLYPRSVELRTMLLNAERQLRERPSHYGLISTQRTSTPACVGTQKQTPVMNAIRVEVDRS
jgi:hypothetical protein